MTALTSIKSCFDWLEAAQDAFDRLKRLFTSVPFLITPDPKRQFIVEVDASDVGVGAVLFFGSFDFTISYRPSSKNMKPDALSRQFGSSENSSTTETILPGGCVVRTVIWDIKQLVKRTLAHVMAPWQCP